MLPVENEETSSSSHFSFRVFSCVLFKCVVIFIMARSVSCGSQGSGVSSKT